MSGNVITVGIGTIGSEADTSSFVEAAARAVAGQTIYLLPGTHYAGNCSIAAGVCIVGEDPTTTVLWSTYDADNLGVDDTACFSCGNGVSWANVWVRRATTGTHRVHLIDFGGATAGQYLIFDNIKVDNGGGTGPYRIDAPVYGSNCVIDFYLNADIGIGVNAAESRWMNCRFNKIDNTSNYIFKPGATASALNLVGCTFTRVGTNAYWLYGAANTPPINLSGCTFVAPTKICACYGSTTLSIAGTDLGGGIVAASDTSTIRFRGNINYGTRDISATTVVVADMDIGLTKSFTATPATMYGWESVAEVQTATIAAASVLNLPIYANTGILQILIKDTGGQASRYPITVTRSSTNTLDLGSSATSSTTYVIKEDYGWVLLSKGNTAGVWRVLCTSRDTLADVQGHLQSYGFFQRGLMAPDGSTSLVGSGLYGTLTTSPVGTYGIDAYGGYLQQNTTGAAGDRAYACTAAANGPLASCSNWDLLFFWKALVQHDEQRIVCGAWGGAVLTDVFDFDAPDGPCALVQKISTSSTAQLYVKINAAGAAAVPVVFPTWTPAADTNYYIVLRKRGSVFVAIVYDTTGAVLDSVTTTITIVNTADLAVVCGLVDTVGVAGRHFVQRSWMGQQISAALASY